MFMEQVGWSIVYCEEHNLMHVYSEINSNEFTEVYSMIIGYRSTALQLLIYLYDAHIKPQ